MRLSPLQYNKAIVSRAFHLKWMNTLQEKQDKLKLYYNTVAFKMGPRDWYQTIDCFTALSSYNGWKKTVHKMPKQTSFKGVFFLNINHVESGMGIKNGKVSWKVGAWGLQWGSRGQRPRWGSGVEAPWNFLTKIRRKNCINQPGIFQFCQFWTWCKIITF